MNATRTLPNEALHDVTTFDILIGGNPMNPSYQVMSIVINKEVNRIPTACIVIRDGEASSGTFALSDTDEFVPGQEISMKAGRDRTNDTVFKGIIIRHSIEVKQSGDANLIIECKDSSVRMTIGRQNRYYEEKKDSQIIEEVVGFYSGLSSDVEDSNHVHKEIVQHHATDWDFVVSRAEVNGHLVIVDDGKIHVKPPDTSTDPVISLLYGSTILSFEAEMDAQYQWGSVKASSWDYANQQIIESTSSSVPFGEQGNISSSQLSETIGLQSYELRHSGQVVQEELQSWADSCILKSRLAKIRGRAQILVGNAQLKPGKMVDLRGVGDRFSGKAFITAVRHEIGRGAWDAHLQFGLSPDRYASREKIIDFPASGLVPAIRGLQIGKVVKLQDDPDGEDRIQVRLPIIDANAAGIWCRVASLDAGENRGAFFRPEIDDEVLIGFINDDPRDAVVVGMLNSSAKPAPLVAQDVNHEKGFTTRSEMHLLFNDDTKTITIDTPAGNSIVIDEASQSIKITDESENTITMEPSGITMDSPLNINIKAGAAINIEATTSLNIKAANIGLKASGPFSAEGAIAKLKSQGITEVSGSLVKIN